MRAGGATGESCTDAYRSGPDARGAAFFFSGIDTSATSIFCGRVQCVSVRLVSILLACVLFVCPTHWSGDTCRPVLTCR